MSALLLPWPSAQAPVGSGGLRLGLGRGVSARAPEVAPYSIAPDVPADRPQLVHKGNHVREGAVPVEDVGVSLGRWEFVGRGPAGLATARREDGQALRAAIQGVCVSHAHNVSQAVGFVKQEKMEVA